MQPRIGRNRWTIGDRVKTTAEVLYLNHDARCALAEGARGTIYEVDGPDVLVVFDDPDLRLRLSHYELRRAPAGKRTSEA